MRDALKTIAKLLPPPASPRGLDRPWDAVERELGLRLPDDYKAFIDLYGTGQVSSAEGWAVIWNFRDTSLSGPSLREWLTGPNCLPEFYRRVINGSEWPCPYPIYPEPGGLRPFANVIDVDALNWLTAGPPDRWGLVYYGCDEQEFTELGRDSFSRCLLKMLRQEYTGSQRPESLVPPFKFTELDL
jgi:hypothetical protein